MNEVSNLSNLAHAVNELEAAKRRVERDARSVASATKKQLVSELLPVLDSLDRMIGNEAGEAAAGARMVRAQLERVLVGYGVVRFDATDQPFDPARHDAVTLVPAFDAEDHDRVIEQLSPGYLFEGALLRPAKVVVGSLRA